MGADQGRPRAGRDRSCSSRSASSTRSRSSSRRSSRSRRQKSARAARVRGLARMDRSSSARDRGARTATTHEVLTGDYASWVGAWAPSELAAGQKLREPRAALPQARRPGSSTDELARLARRTPGRDRHARAPRRARRSGSGRRPRPRQSGVTRIITIGHRSDLVAPRTLDARRSSTTAFTASSGVHPHEACVATSTTSPRSSVCSSIPSVVGAGRSGLDYLPRLRPARCSEQAVHLPAQARDAGKAAGRHPQPSR